MVVDGTGEPARAADVLVRDGEIVHVGTPPREIDARGGIEAEGLVVAPGFLDGHSHAAEGLSDPELSAARSQLAQGVTTVILNPDGAGAVDLADQREALRDHGLGVNVYQLIPHGSLRRQVMGNDDRDPTPEELVELARTASGYGGVYHRHVRDEGGYSVGVLKSNRELIRIAREAGLPAIHPPHQALRAAGVGSLRRALPADRRGP